MRRLALVAALLMLGAAPAHAATNEYSTGNIRAAIGATLDRALTVRHTGPVSFVRVSFRIGTPDTSKLAITLVSAKGTHVPLVVNRGAGADFGSEAKGCGGTATVFESDMTTNPIARGVAPFTENPYRAEGNLRSLYGENARGRWTLHVENGGAPATLYCFTLDISRAVVQTLSARRGSVRASVGFVERNYLYRDVTLRIVRRGRTVANRPIEKFGCRACFESRPFELTIRDLDGGEPEVLVDLYTGGAHCCSITLILRYDRGRYRATLGYWGNFGSELVDLDGDRRPEFAAYDERFVYTFAAYVFSAAPVQIWDYRQGKLVDVTRRFPKLVRADAASHWKRYLSERGEKETDVRSVVAAYVADQYLLGNPSEAKRALDLALKRGDLGRGKTLLGWPAGTAFVAELTKDLRKWRYRR